MALYVKVFTSFFSSRKTIRLRAILGNDALWVPIRLWSYAAENQPDGDFSGYSADEIAMLIGYQGDALGMLEALQKACFLDGLQIHDWEEHNSYHKTFSDRARAGGIALREKRKREREEKKGEEREPSGALSTTEAPPPPINEDEIDGLITEDQAATQSENQGIPADFARFIHQDWHSRGGKDGGSVKCPFARYAKKRWVREGAEWTAGNHSGKRKNTGGKYGNNSASSGGSIVGRSHDPEGKAASLY